MIRYLIEKATVFLIPFCKRVVIRDRLNQEPYLIRYILFKSDNFSIYIHRFMKSDIDVPHDHPWDFFSYVITKGYLEAILEPIDKKTGRRTQSYVVRSPGSLAFRKAEHAHVVHIAEGPYQEHQEGESPLTICIILKRKRSWGFIADLWDKAESKIIGYKWINWFDYLSVPETDPDHPRYQAKK